PLLGASPIPVICSIILTLDFPLLEAEVALIAGSDLHGSLMVNLGNWHSEVSLCKACCACKIFPSAFMTASRAGCQSCSLYQLPSCFLRCSLASGNVISLTVAMV
ncbi:hypothetical protein L208DRAFT_1250181, partial [Tricholoma matsutake]